MGELYRRARARRARSDDKATEAQITFLRRLVLEDDGEVDDDWLASLTKREASEEISRRLGRHNGHD